MADLSAGSARMTRWVTAPGEAGGGLPVALVARAPSPEARRALLRHLVAAMFGHAPDEVRIAHEPDLPPRLLGPGGVHLSSASRDGWAALAVACGPVGIDIERVLPGAESPWHVLHPAEAAWLRDLSEGERDHAFTRLWTVKEAYLKALGTGLAREPGSFFVEVLDEGRAQIDDPLARSQAVAETRWFAEHNVVASLVRLQLR